MRYHDPDQTGGGCAIRKCVLEGSSYCQLLGEVFQRANLAGASNCQQSIWSSWMLMSFKEYIISTFRNLPRVFKLFPFQSYSLLVSLEFTYKIFPGRPLPQNSFHLFIRSKRCLECTKK